MLLAAALVGGCSNSPPVDQNFGTDLGADFRAPITDASATGDTNVTPDSGVDGAGTGGTGTGGTGTSGTGTGGAGGQAADGSGGAAGQAAAGSGGAAGSAS